VSVVFSAEEKRNKEKWSEKVFQEKNGLLKLKKTIFIGEKMKIPDNQCKSIIRQSACQKRSFWEKNGLKRPFFLQVADSKRSEFINR
jgi:hypothetical protein